MNNELIEELLQFNYYRKNHLQTSAAEERFFESFPVLELV
jgi:hypothetical protein